MSSRDEDGTPRIMAGDMQKTRGLAITASLQLGLRAIEHVEEHRVSVVTMAERIASEGEGEWHIRATFDGGETVKIAGHVDYAYGVQLVNLVELQQLHHNGQQGFDLVVPLSWVKLASAQAGKLEAL